MSPNNSMMAPTISSVVMLKPPPPRPIGIWMPATAARKAEATAATALAAPILDIVALAIFIVVAHDRAPGLRDPPGRDMGVRPLIAIRHNSAYGPSGDKRVCVARPTDAVQSRRATGTRCSAPRRCSLRAGDAEGAALLLVQPLDEIDLPRQIRASGLDVAVVTLMRVEHEVDPVAIGGTVG